MNNSTKGSCLCNRVKFEVIGDFESFFLCHCTHCQKDTGSAHAANLFSGSATLNWISGKEYVSTYNVPGTRHVKSFCSKCGSAMPRTSEGEKHIVVPAGSIDDQISIMPTANIFMASKAKWAENLDSIESFDILPQ